MKRPIKLIQNRCGATLLELLVALAITGVVTTAVLKLYITQHQNYLTQDDITTIQQNARASIDELTRQIRMAGNQLPPGLEAIVASNTNPDTIQITYLSSGCDTYLSAKMPQPSAELKCGTDISCFSDGQWVYIYDPNDATGEWFEITHVQEDAFHIQHNTMVLSKAYDADALVLAMDQVKFFVDNTTDPYHPRLMVQPIGQNPQIYADNITDLQFRYRLANGTVIDQPVLAEDIREVQITVSARSDLPDVENPANPYRTRAYSSSVNLRNIGA